MGLEILSENGENLLSVPPTERNGNWAYSLNNLRRDILFRIMQTFPSPEDIRTKILPLFYRAIGALESIPQNKQDPLAYHIPGFLKNFQIGARELEAYITHFENIL